MSTIVVVKRDSAITMAADTRSVQGEQKTGAAHHPICKIIDVNGTLIGISGPSSAKLAVVHYFENNPEQARFGSVSEIFSTWLALHSALRSDYFLNSGVDDDTSYETSRMDVLVANETGAYVVTEHRSVDEVLRYHAIGMGDQYALGAMHALYENENLNEEQIARAAISAAAEFHTGTALPTTVCNVCLSTRP